MMPDRREAKRPFAARFSRTAAQLLSHPPEIIADAAYRMVAW